MIKAIRNFVKRTIKNIKIRKFRRIVEKERFIVMYGRVFRILMIGNVFVRCESLRDHRTIDLYLDKIEINKDGKTYSLKNTSLFF